ncbi:MAG: alanine racemase [Candidatus Omnitrophica bacterium]|nr:alanine racemase [Candidatus Omnitrophota bacterium]
MDDRIIEINISNIKSNIAGIKKFTKKLFLAVVKCNAYGMGAPYLSRFIEEDVDYFGVETIEEAIQLRKGKIKKPVLILGQILQDDVEYISKYNLIVTIGSLEFFKYVSGSIKTRISAHIKFDTGMGRLGIMPQSAEEVLNIIHSSKNINVEGVFSHLATSEDPDKNFAMEQLNVFKNILKKFHPNKYVTHIANSGAIINLPESYKDFSMVRSGLLLYGVYPGLFLRTFKRKPFIKSALTGKAKVLLIKNLPAGASIGYGRTYTCKKNTRIVLVGIGYGDGLNKSLSNRIFVKIKDRILSARGNISMDQIVVEIPQDLDVKQGDECIFLDDELNIENMAEICKTVPHEILCNLGKERLKKIYIH